MKDRGWRVVRVELDATHRPDVVADVRHLPLSRCRPDLVWASPPCTEFSRESMPWCRTGRAPSLDLARATIAAIAHLDPRWWVIENVRGAVKWLEPLVGRPTLRIGAAYLWGRFPLPFGWSEPARTKEAMWPSADRASRRSEIPYEISRVIADACEREVCARA